MSARMPSRRHSVKRAGSVTLAQIHRVRPTKIRSNSVYTNDYPRTPSPSGSSPRHSPRHSRRPSTLSRCEKCDCGHGVSSRTNSQRRPSMSISAHSSPNRSRRPSNVSIALSLHTTYPGPPSPTRSARSGSFYANDMHLHPGALLHTRSNSVASQRSLARSAQDNNFVGLHPTQRQKIVFIITATFLVLVFLSIAAVLVTLTHRSEIQVGINETKTIYTFAP